MRPSRWSICLAVLACASLLISACDGWLETSGSRTEPQDNRFRPHPAPSNAENHSNNNNSSDPSQPAPSLDPGTDTSELSCDGVQPPGETPLLRLTEREYNNTVRQLFPDLELSSFEIPGDEQLGPFKLNFSSSVGQVVAERYQAASETISEKAAQKFATVTDCQSSGGPEQVDSREAEQVGSDVGQSQGEFWNVWSNGDLSAQIEFPSSGTYTIRAVAAGTKADGVGPNMQIQIDGSTIREETVDATQDSPQAYEATADVTQGTHSVGVEFTNDKNTDNEDRNLLVDKLVVLKSGIDAGQIDGCMDQFITDFATQAWRQPLSSEQQSRLKSLYDSAVDQYDAKFGLRVLVEAVLQSPRFVYRFKTGETDNADNGAVPLTDFETASRLSYFLWNSGPDAELLEAAKNGELSTKEGIRKQADRMIEDQRARDTLNRAILSIFGLRDFEDNDKESGDIDKATRQAMKEETLAFIDHVLWEADGRLETLLTAEYAFVSPQTRSTYSNVDVPDGNGMQRVTFDQDAPRAGILTQPAILSRYGWGEGSVHRGVFLSHTMLCSRPPDPPNELKNPPKRTEGESDRSQAQDRMEHQQCGTCHRRMEPMGLVFDRFDAEARYRETDEHGNELTMNGKLVGTDNQDGEVNGPKELARRLADSDRVERCFTQQWLKRALARVPTQKEACAMKTVSEALDQSDGDLKEMFVAITTTEAFRYKPAPSE